MLLFVHGWGLNATLWDTVRAKLDAPAATVDLGYSAVARPAEGQGRVIGIGHSFGALWLLHHRADRLSGFIAISGFARFTAAPDWPHGVPPRLLHRMRSTYPSRPAEVLDQFRARCGLPPWLGPRDDARLAADLDALADWDARETLRRLDIPVLCLAAADDQLLPPDLAPATAALANTTCRWAPNGGHVLPLTQPDWCAQQIAAFATS